MITKLRDIKFIAIFGVAFVISLKIYSLYFLNLNFGDEYDNFTYSWLFKNGVLPYRDFFTHHYPFLIFLGLPLEFIGHSQTLFRFFVLAVTFAFFGFFSFYQKGIWRWITLIFMLFSSFAISFYSGQQFADGTFWAIFIVGGFLLVFTKQGLPLNKYELLLFSLLFIFTIFSSPLHFLAFAMLIVFHVYLGKSLKIKNSFKKNLQNLIGFLKISIIASLLLLIFLILTKSFNDFVYDTLTFNSQFFYGRVYTPYINLQFVDFYLHTSRDVINHFAQLVLREGSELVTFLKAAKFLFWPFAISSYPDYLKVIFTDLYNNFFSFEMFIALFYFLGISALLLRKEFKLAIIIIIFIFSLRMRLLDRIHMAPFYLLSYWMVATAIVLFLESTIKRKKLLAGALGLILTVGVLTLFVKKNWYDFGLVAFNRYSKTNEETVYFLTNDYKDKENILVITDESASYYYDSQRFPFSRFVNYFEWYDWSERLRGEWFGAIDSYNGRFLVVDKKKWNAYCSLSGTYDKWLEPTLAKVRENFLVWHQTKDTIILVKRKPDEEQMRCLDKI